MVKKVTEKKTQKNGGFQKSKRYHVHIEYLEKVKILQVLWTLVDKEIMSSLALLDLPESLRKNCPFLRFSWSVFSRKGTEKTYFSSSVQMQENLTLFMQWILTMNQKCSPCYLNVHFAKLHNFWRFQRFNEKILLRFR